MVSVEIREGISETLEILEHMDEIYVSKIPQKFKNFLEENKSLTYKPKLDHTKCLNELKLKEKTKDILAVIYLNYWCDSNEKVDFVKILNNNEVKYQEEIREKYNSDNLFKNRNYNFKVQNEQTALVEVKKLNFFQKLLNKIKQLFIK